MIGRTVDDVCDQARAFGEIDQGNVRFCTATSTPAKRSVMARPLWLQFAGAIYLSNIVVLEDPGVALESTPALSCTRVLIFDLLEQLLK